MLKVCEYCEKEYYTKYKPSRFCCTACKEKMREKILNRVCKYCGKNFRAKDKRYVTYCSRECVIKLNKSKALPLKICKYCGIEFKPKASDIKYCSRECYKKYQKESKGSFGYSGIKECNVCGKKFTVNVKHTVYCSKKCAYHASYDKQKKHNITKEKKEKEKEKNIKNCECCGKEFEAYRSRQIFCSTDCCATTMSLRKKQKRIQKKQENKNINQYQ